jgi:hypothetical protein
MLAFYFILLYRQWHRARARAVSRGIGAAVPVKVNPPPKIASRPVLPPSSPVQEKSLGESASCRWRAQDGPQWPVRHHMWAVPEPEG